MKPIFSTQIMARATLAAFIFMTEILVAYAVREWYGSYGHDVIYVSTSFLVLIATFLLGNSKLIVDFRDLCFYDVIVHCFGWWLYANGYSLQLFYALSATILTLKFVRILWAVQTTTRDALADWPIFGPFGYWQAWQQSSDKSSSLLAFSRQDRLAYLVIFASLPVIYVLREVGVKMPPAFWALLGVALVLRYFSPFLLYLEEREIKHREDAKKAAEQEATARLNVKLEALNAQLKQANLDLAHNQQQLHAKNAELEHKHQELEQAHATTSQLLREREQDKAVLEKYNAAMRDAAHDLQHPMLIVRHYADSLIACDENGSDAETRQETGAELTEAIDQMVEFIDATIHSAQVVTGLLQPKTTAINMARLALQFQASWLDAANQQGLDGFDVFPRWDKVLYSACDLTILKRILRNLIANAIQHSPKGGAILLSMRKRGVGCLVQVWDQGAGIAEGQGRDGAANFMAFALHVRAERSEQGLLGATSGGGYGLGMNNVLQLCGAINVQMHLHARLGRGSVFSFMLPLADASMIEEAQQQSIKDKLDLEEVAAIFRARNDIPMPVYA